MVEHELVYPGNSDPFLLAYSWLFGVMSRHQSWYITILCNDRTEGGWSLLVQVLRLMLLALTEAVHSCGHM